MRKRAMRVTLRQGQISALANGPLCYDNSGSKQTRVLQAARRKLGLERCTCKCQSNKSEKEQHAERSLQEVALDLPAMPGSHFEQLLQLNHRVEMHQLSSPLTVDLTPRC